MGSCCSSFVSTMSIYKSTKFIRVHHPKLALTYYITILLLLTYVIGYSIIYSRGYQGSDAIIGTTSVKVKGTASLHTWGHKNFTVFDAKDLVVPSVEADALFVATSTTFTQQSRGNWTGNKESGACEKDNDCVAGTYNAMSAGILTGRCVVSDVYKKKFCEITGWGPLEIDETPQVLENVEKFTVFVKVNGRFDKYNLDYGNTKDKLGNHHPVPGYNLFTTKEIVELANNSYSDLTRKGGIFIFTTEYDCDLDKSHKCEPTFTVQRIDNLLNSVSTGFNFRTVSYGFDTNNQQIRTLTKFIGIRVLFHLTGSAKKFDMIVLTTTLGAGIALLGIATYLCDIVLENFLGDTSKRYERHKNQDLAEDGNRILHTPSVDYNADPQFRVMDD